MQTTPTDPNVTQVRNTLKRVLSDSPWFLSRPPDEQVNIYKDLLVTGLENLERGNLVPALADPPPINMRDVPELAGQFLDEVDFVTFVRELITGVYGSITQATIQQMEATKDYIKELAKPIGQLAQGIDDIDAKAEVAAGNPLRFTMSGSGDLTDNDSGMKVDESNDEYNRLLFEAKLKLAHERRLMLREFLLMGVQRLAVRDGKIKAGLIFNIRSTEQSAEQSRRTDIQQSGGQFGGSFLGLFGGGSNKRNTKISVSTKQIQRNTELTAQITGHVEVNFYSDLFNLNNFADLFGDESTRAVIAQRTGEAPASGRPPAPAAPAPSAPRAPVPAGIAR